MGTDDRPTLSLGDSSDAFVCCVWKNVVITVFHKPLTAHILRRIDVSHAAVAKAYAQTFSLSITATSFAFPDSETRKVAAELIASRAKRVLVSAIVLEGTGLWVSTARSITTGLFLLSGSSGRNRVFSTIDDAVRWGVPLVEPAHDAGELLAAATIVRNIVPGANAKLP